MLLGYLVWITRIPKMIRCHRPATTSYNYLITKVKGPKCPLIHMLHKWSSMFSIERDKMSKTHVFFFTKVKSPDLSRKLPAWRIKSWPSYGLCFSQHKWLSMNRNHPNTSFSFQFITDSPLTGYTPKSVDTDTELGSFLSRIKYSPIHLPHSCMTFYLVTLSIDTLITPLPLAQT